MRLIDDPRWIDFVERYAGKLGLFAAEVCGSSPTHQQVDLYQSVQEPGSKTSVSSGKGTGKSYGIGTIATWHLLCHYSQENNGSICILTATKIEQVRNIAWKEIVSLKERILRGPHAWIADYYEVEAERVYVKGFKDTWWVTAKTAPKGAHENLSGFHSEWMLIIGDEASGIPDKNLGTLVNTMTDGRNRMLLVSQPTRPAGFFYETQNKLSKANGGPWTALVFDSEESPLVDSVWVAEREQEYGGRDTEEFLINVKGRFPESSSKFLIARPLVDRAFDSPIVIPASMAWGWFVSVDVAAGEYRDKSTVIIGKMAGFADFGEDARRVEVTGIPIYSSSIQPKQLAGRVHEICTSLQDASLFVDAGGMGILFCKELEAFDTPNLTKVKWGNPCFNKRLKDRFVNQRAQCTVGTRDALRDGRLGIHQTTHKAEIVSQASRLPYSFDEKARYFIHKKGTKEWEGMPSPDIWDAVCFPFLADASFIVTEGAEETGAAAAQVAKKSAQEKAADAFKDA